MIAYYTKKITAARITKNEKSRRRPTLARAGPALPSAMERLTSVFGMGTGMAAPPWSPAKSLELGAKENHNCTYEGGKLSR